MTYRLDGVEYDEDDFNKIGAEEISKIRQLAEKVARDKELLISRGKKEWASGGPGLSKEEFATYKSDRDEALGLIDAIKVYLG